MAGRSKRTHKPINLSCRNLEADPSNEQPPAKKIRVNGNMSTSAPKIITTSHSGQPNGKQTAFTWTISSYQYGSTFPTIAGPYRRPPQITC